MAAAIFAKIDKSPYLGNGLTIVAKFAMVTQNGPLHPIGR